MWIWLFAFLATVFVWAGSLIASAFGLEVALWLRIAATVAILVFTAGVLVFRIYRRGAAARALEREILKQSEQQALNVRPDRRAEIMELRERMAAALGAVQKRGGKGLSTLPWYVIVGPPGAGKTTALRHSGLPFAFGDAQGGALRGIGGTRNCDFWFTNEAIVLDTAGRYATQDDDRNEWFGFLDLLKRYRKERPINGVILAISVSELVDTRGDALAGTAKRLRARIDEIMSRLDMIVPVYVMFTKTDLVDGFVEFWGELRKSERDQVFGATFPLRTLANLDAPRAFEREFRALVSRVQAHAVRRLPFERTYVGRQKILEFPLELRAIERNLSEFIGVLFQQNRYQGTPHFRGFYFTSGTQEGSPVSRVLSEVSRAFGLGAPPQLLERREPKSYFVTDLFLRVIFPDRNVAGRTRAGARRHLLYRLAVAGSSALFSILIVIPAAVSFLRNHALIDSAEDVIRHNVEQGGMLALRDKPSLAPGIERLDAQLAFLTKLEKWRADGPPFSLGFGLFTGDELLDGVKDVYAREVSQAFQALAQPELEHALAATTVGANDTAAYTHAYDQFKLYLMLGQPSHLEPAWAAPRLAEVAAKSLHSRAPEGDAKALTPHALKYLDSVLPKQPWALDQKLVAQTRQLLRRAPQIERQYVSLVRAAEEEIAPIRAQDVFYGSIAPFITSKRGAKVSGAYTKLGYDLVMRRLADRGKVLSAEAWVLDDPTADGGSAQADEIVAKLQDMYFDRFSQAWRDFFTDLDVARPPNEERQLALLTALNEAEYPYQRLIRMLSENVRFRVDDGLLTKELKRRIEQRKRALLTKAKLTNILPSSPAAPAPQSSTTPMEDDFAPLLEFGAPKPGQRIAPGLGEYLAFLTDLSAAMTDARDAAMPREKATKQKSIAVKATVAKRGTEKLLDGLGENRTLMQALLRGPLEVGE